MKWGDTVYSELFVKTVGIGFVTLLSKVILIVIPYLITPEAFYSFNKSYYPLSLVIVLATFGFEFSYQRCSVSLKKLTFVVLLNAAAVIFILTIIGVIEINPIYYMLILPAAVISILTSVSSFSLLFNKKLKKYVLMLSIFYGSLLIIFVVFIKVFNDAFSAFAISLVFAFASVYYFIRNEIKGNGRHISGLYKYGINALVINGFFAVVMSLNNINAGKLLTVDEANNIVLVWQAGIPLLYLSNILEKVIYNSKGLKSKIFKWGMVNLIIMSAYTLMILIIIHYFDFLLPAAANKILLSRYMTYVFSAIFVFAVLNSGVNSFVFKYLDYKNQTVTTVYFAIILMVYFVISMLFMNGVLRTDDVTLVVLASVTLFLGILGKAYIVTRNLKSRG